MAEFTIPDTDVENRAKMEAAYGLTGKDLDYRLMLDLEQMIRHRVFRHNQRAVGLEEEAFSFKK